MRMPTATTPKKTPMSCHLSTRRRIIASGNEMAITDIMKASTVPRAAPFSMSACTMGIHDHPLRSGAREQGIRRRAGEQKAAVQHAPEEVLPLPAAVEPVAELIVNDGPKLTPP